MRRFHSPLLLASIALTSASMLALPAPVYARSLDRSPASMTVPAPELTHAEAPEPNGEQRMDPASTGPEDPLSGAKAELAKLQLERETRQEQAAIEALRRSETLAELHAQSETLEAQSELAAAQRQRQADLLKAELASIGEQNARADAQRAALESQMATSKAQTALGVQAVDQRLALAEARRRDQTLVTGEIEYRDNPLVDGVLEITDRRIALNGPITLESSTAVVDRLNFYNNKSQRYPIFIVIDYSPGGSVMAGYRIIKAIEASQAPVHVVVKSFAASMAAVIATLAPHSYAFPNAILLHHQLSGASFGNLTEQREQVQEAAEWSHRLTGPLAKKLHVTEQQFVKEMYLHNSRGDWSEFADRAVKLGWIDRVIDGVRERGMVSLNAGSEGSPPAARGDASEQTDEHGVPHVRLPHLAPFDLWFLYDPTEYYR